VRFDRLTLLASFLESDCVPEAHFHLENWECGTTACACGWAARIPQFKESGFKLSSLGNPLFEEFSRWDAVMRFFELTRSQAEYLFLARCYIGGYQTTKWEVAERIRDFVAANRLTPSLTIEC
jgi:hypothetical protein